MAGKLRGGLLLRRCLLITCRFALWHLAALDHCVGLAALALDHNLGALLALALGNHCRFGTLRHASITVRPAVLSANGGHILRTFAYWLLLRRGCTCPWKPLSFWHT